MGTPTFGTSFALSSNQTLTSPSTDEETEAILHLFCNQSIYSLQFKINIRHILFSKSNNFLLFLLFDFKTIYCSYLRVFVKVLFIMNRIMSFVHLAVSSHHSEVSLVKFVHKAHVNEVLVRIKVHSTLFQIRPWRPLSRAFVVDMSFRVLLKMENVLTYAWTPHVVERIIGHRCSFDRLEPRSAFMDSTETLDVWVWTTDPSAIPNVIWLTFMSRSLADRVSEILVTDYHLSGVKHGSTFRFLLYLATVENYMATPPDYNRSAPWE